MDTLSLFEDFARQLTALCSHVSVRMDENGPFLFALGVKGIHTLQLRRSPQDYEVERWRGEADNEALIDTCHFDTSSAAFDAAMEWLQRDCG